MKLEIYRINNKRPWGHIAHWSHIVLIFPHANTEGNGYPSCDPTLLLGAMTFEKTSALQ
jgi:hypothetical protein